ncbi:MAG: RNA 2',3'-cyclic phosphodiesterase [Verrucomicrobiota bacterium JB022]|nr:RNA 2',3'-cyclic phosphodiesterase [Verrucomicrobiota bacterium JB022]
MPRLPHRRLFFAIDVPEYVQEALLRLYIDQKNWQWVRPENMHLTLKFLGATPGELAEEVIERMAGVAGRAFMLPVEEVGVFPSVQRPQVVWAGLGGGHPELFGLQKRIEDACFALGIQPEKRRYSPHLTLARVSQASPESVRQFVKAQREFSAPPFRVEAFHLYRSELQDHHRVYIKEATWLLHDERAEA